MTNRISNLLRQEGTHRVAPRDMSAIKLVNCSKCGVELLGRSHHGQHMPKWVRERWEPVHIHVPDADRPHANHWRPLCLMCTPSMEELRR